MTLPTRHEQVRLAYRTMADLAGYRPDWRVPPPGPVSSKDLALETENCTARFVKDAAAGRFHIPTRPDDGQFNRGIVYAIEAARAFATNRVKQAASLLRVALVEAEVRLPVPQVIEIPEITPDTSDELVLEIPEGAPSVYGPKLGRLDEDWEPAA